MTETGRQLTTQQKDAKNIQSFLLARKGTFAALLPAYLTPERMLKGVMATAARNPRILECTTESILNVVIVASTLGLEIGNPRGGMHMVPFRNGRTGKYEATGIPDYRGLMGLAYNSGQVLSIRATAVYTNDEFDYAEGTRPFITHVPTLKGDKGDLLCVYAVAELKDLGPQFKVVPLWEVNEHRERSRAKSKGPWVDDYVAMALKTAVKMLCNWLPAAPVKLVQAVEYEDRADRGDSLGDMFEGVLEVEAEQVETQSQKAIDDLKSRGGAPDSPEQNQERGPGDGSTEESPSPPPPTEAGAISQEFLLPRRMQGEETAHPGVHRIRKAFGNAGKEHAESYYQAEDGFLSAAAVVTDPKEREIVLGIACYFLGRQIAGPEIWGDLI